MLDASKLGMKHRKFSGLYRKLPVEYLVILLATNIALIGLVSIEVKSLWGLIGVGFFLHVAEVYFLISLYRSNHSYQQHPPKFGEYLFQLLISKKDSESLLGDLAEEYGHIQTKFGARKARVWYYKQVFFSIWPLLRYGIRLSWGRSIARLMGYIHFRG